MRYEDFSCNLLRIGGGKGIPTPASQSLTEKNVGSVVSATLTPASVATAVVVDQTGFTIPGVEATDLVMCVRNPITNATGVVKVTATAQNTVTITFVNPTAGALTPTTGTYTFLVFKTQ